MSFLSKIIFWKEMDIVLFPSLIYVMYPQETHFDEF